ncbi:hypothetical protein KUV85_15790 [Nocardioides panacisoli]|uniref:DUF5667 domain-containing protein n=1 Tax=Nocardioides panacisoli TaxID=627624 RepID=UPI001C632F65|nr:DUF5667 domain-containing protein [Nocardioides panacisoli]QYJ03768.1 hypothetical protein KUV85_15790 [Nocardioides panacisoli]
MLSGEITDVDGVEAELAELVGAMRELPPVEARPDFVASLREHLMAEAATMPAVDPDRATVEHLSLHQPTVRRERRIATVLGGLAVASATTSMAVASQGALPGETLYPVKRAIENAESTFQADGAEKSHTLLEHAQRRLVEVRELSADGSDGVEVAEALDGLNNQATEAATLSLEDYRASGDDQGVREVRSFAATALAELTGLSEDVPADARPALVGAVNALRNIEAAAVQACATCAGPADLPDPMLVANLQTLLSGDPTELQSLARTAEDIAGEAPSVDPTLPGGPTAAPTAAPSTGAAPSTPSAPSGGGSTPTGQGQSGATSGGSSDLSTIVPETLKKSKGPVTTLLDEVSNDLEKLSQPAEGEDWTLLNNGLVRDLTDGLGLTGGN